MAESMQGLKRSHRCAEVSNALEGQKVTVMGWVQKSRNKGGIIFVDLVFLLRQMYRQSRSRRTARQKKNYV